VRALIGALAVFGVLAVLGCSKSPSQLEAAVASGDNDRIQEELSSLAARFGDYDEAKVERILLNLRESDDVRVQDMCYRLAARHKLPKFVELYDQMLVSQNVEERSLVAFHPMTVGQVLALLNDDEPGVQIEAMMGAYSLRNEDVTPIVKEGLGERFAGSLIQYDAVGLANERGITSVAPAIVATLRYPKRAGIHYGLIEDRIFNYVRGYKLEEYYDEVAPFDPRQNAGR